MRTRSNIPALIVALTLQTAFTYLRFSPKIKALINSVKRVYAEELKKQPHPKP